ncbi:alpha/beta hydrolase [Streptomyces sp. NPDC006261]|uniref:esterase/lipase family protein n=1 Tax=Streptomyces sp. NPDC006261 TaxID=3156739 RepID=UPI0033BCCDD2
MLTIAPAGAATKPSRSNGNGNRVIFVHGHSPVGKHDCAKVFSSARKHFADNGWKGNLLTFGYYSKNKNCSYNAGGSRETSIKEVAKKFANYVSKNYTEKNKKVDVVAHSMGGLVVRAALHYTHKRAAGFPKKLYIEDVVTPHAARRDHQEQGDALRKRPAVQGHEAGQQLPQGSPEQDAEYHEERQHEHRLDHRLLVRRRNRHRVLGHRRHRGPRSPVQRRNQPR